MKIFMQLKLVNLASVLVALLVMCFPVCADNFKINVIYPGGTGIDSMLKSSVESVPSPDFDVNYITVDSTTWTDEASLANFLVTTQQGTPADGFFLACYNNSMADIGDQFRKTFPKVPYVDSFMPALMAAQIVSFRYLVLTGNRDGTQLATELVKELGIENHLKSNVIGASSAFNIVTGYFDLTTLKSVTIPDIVSIGLSNTNAHNVDLVVNIEAIALAGCEGFLDIGVALEAQQQLATHGYPLQVINPVKASMALLYSLIRNKVWITRKKLPL